MTKQQLGNGVLIVIKDIKLLLTKRHLVPNLVMIEILEALSADHLEAKARGLVELYERLTEPKPTFITFRKNIEMLDSADCIDLTISSEKKSKRMVTITAKFYKELEQHTSTIGGF